MDTIFAQTTERMEKCLDSLDRDFSTIRAGRANPNVLNNVMVDYYGTPTKIDQMAAVSVPEPRMLVIQPWDASMLKEIEKAINVAEIGINPQNDGKVIRLTFPQLTEEHRKTQNIHLLFSHESTKLIVMIIRSTAHVHYSFRVSGHMITTVGNHTGPKQPARIPGSSPDNNIFKQREVITNHESGKS